MRSLIGLARPPTRVPAPARTRRRSLRWVRGPEAKGAAAIRSRNGAHHHETAAAGMQHLIGLARPTAFVSTAFRSRRCSVQCFHGLEAGRATTIRGGVALTTRMLGVGAERWGIGAMHTGIECSSLRRRWRPSLQPALTKNSQSTLGHGGS